MSFISYAQNFEDVILWRALKHVENGFYIDVGAQDPYIDSVSLAFYERGWRGIHVEPNEIYAQQLREARPDEQVIQSAIGVGVDEITFFVIPDTGLSTGEESIARQHEAQGYTVNRVSVPCQPLAAILDSCQDREIHWLKIDVEGMEAKVIESWSNSRVRPWIAVVESTKPNSPTKNHMSWEPKLLRLGYDFVYFDGLNRFYISVEHAELRDSFGPGPNYFDDFVLSGTSSFCKKIVADAAGQLAEAQAAKATAETGLSEEREARRAIEACFESRLAEAQTHLVEARSCLAEERAAKEAVESSLSEEREARRAMEAGLESRLAEAQTCLTESQHAKSVLENGLLAVHASTSWRVTKPFRFASENGRWFIRGAWAWLSFKPGSRPRRVARSAVANLANDVRAKPHVLGAVRRTLPFLPPSIAARLRLIASGASLEASASPPPQRSDLSPRAREIHAMLQAAMAEDRKTS